MTQEEKRIKIAELNDWKMTSRGDWTSPSGRRHQDWGGGLSCPDYFNDANTRPEMIEILRSRGLIRHILNNVCVLMTLPSPFPNEDRWEEEHMWMCLSVPQNVFAEAYGVTRNLWGHEV